MIWKLVAAFCLAGVIVCFASPWLNPWLERRNQPQRLLDRLVEEWDREGDSAPREPWNW